MSDQHIPRHRASEEVSAKPDLPRLEEEILEYWADNQVFEESVDQRPAGDKGANEFVFYDGPPFANGLPHYGHLLTGYVKDVVGRYQTMLGHRVERRFGWDTHGLPAELEAERELGIVDKTEIEGECGMGIEAFNAACRRSVLKYTGEWENYVNRQARWVDFDDDYKTLDPDYMESVLWAFKTLYDKGLVYEGYKVLPYCWNDETPLSNHELRMDEDVYRERTDQTVTVAVALLDEEGEPTGEWTLLWTTTPWTLPSNLAVAVGPDIDYVEVVPDSGELAGKTIILAQARLAEYAAELGAETEQDLQIARRLKGSDLVGRRYAPIFPYFEGEDPNAFQILGGDFVTTEDGSGLVHLAPAFGEDDMAVCLSAGIKTRVPVDEGGKFTSEIPEYAGTQVFDSNRLIIADLREGTGALQEVPESRRARLVKQASYAHSYPHCWRCREPLIYKAVGSWFVEVTKIRDRMVELNQQINWVPSHIKDGQFGMWLAGARDWSISRNRFWGAPIPVWKSDNPDYPRVDVYGSFEQIREDFGVDEVNLHRPFVDDLVRPNPDDPTGRSMMRRVPEVLDCWFESGAMPFAQVHYPFENRTWFEDHYPGDFIVEYIGQTRGWFYTLHVLATALFDRPAFRNAVSHGIVLGDDGRKMSKSLRNYPDVNGVFDTYGSDAMRWFLMSSPVVRGGNLIVNEEGVRDAVRQVLLPLWNTYYFLALYANVCNGGEGIELNRLDQASEERIAALPEMERYLLARTGEVATAMRAAMDDYDIPGAAALFRDHLDVVTNWYVRTQRQRFWDEEQDSFDALYTALLVMSEAAAPLLPLMTEEIWRGLTGGASVHLVDYPNIPASWEDPDLVMAMDSVREVVSAAHSLRKTNRLRVRQPLASMSVVAENAKHLERFAPLIAGEVNVKEVKLAEPGSSGFSVREELGLNPRAFSPEWRPLTSKLFAAQKQGRWEVLADGSVLFPDVTFAGEPLKLSGDQITLSARVDAGGDEVAAVLESGTFVVLDAAITPELEAEGYARDVIRSVQDARKNAGLHISDRIRLRLGVPKQRIEAARAHEKLIGAETLATEILVEPAADDELTIEVEKL